MTRRLLVLPVLGAAIAIAIFLARGDSRPIDDTAGSPADPAVAATPEAALARALHNVGPTSAEGGGECRRVSVAEVREGLAGDGGPFPGWVIDAPEQLRVWACPLLVAGGGRGMGFVAAESTPFEIGWTIGQEVRPKAANEEEPTQGGGGSAPAVPQGG